MADDKGKQLLDDKVVEYFNTLDSLYICQQELQDHMSEGFFNLSKARYTMGVKAVGSLQFDSRKMTATTRVNVCEGDLETSDDLFLLVRNAPENEEVEFTSTRKRHTRATGNLEDDDAKFDDMDWINEEIKKMGIEPLDGFDDTKKNSKPSSQDPLKWFGVLVPQTLRNSQRNFENATQLVVEMANLRRKLLAIKDGYEALRKDVPNDN